MKLELPGKEEIQPMFFSSSQVQQLVKHVVTSVVQLVCNNTLLRCLSVYDEKCSRMQP